MTIIDHRILIPAAPDVVWDYISDITHNPDWQVDCREVIFLTSRREGPGVRWRYAAPNGHEYVTAVTAWYNGLGYEYYLVDGVPYRENKGRIRLQEIPEGTIVQWTFTYELGGLFGGMRNALGVSRQVDQTIAESLKTLWQKIKESGAAARPHEAKSLMRDAPNVDARSAYQPRHPSHIEPETQKPELLPLSQFQAEPPISEDDGQAISIIAEPPIKQDDTRPRPAVTVPSMESVVPLDLEGEPEFLDRLVAVEVDLSRFEPPRDPSDTQPRSPTVVPEPVAAEPEFDEPEFDEPESEEPEFIQSEFAEPISDEAEAVPPPPAIPTPTIGEETEPLGFPLPKVLPIYQTPLTEAPTAAVPEVIEETQPQTQPEPEPAAPPTHDEPMTEPATTMVSAFEAIIHATPAPDVEPPAPEPESIAPPAPPAPLPEPNVAGAAVSIWEIFGVARPSETQETAALKLDAPLPASEPVAAVLEPALAFPGAEKASLPRGSTRIGLRIVLRRKLVRVRRP